VTISSLLNFGRPVPPGRGSAAGRKCVASESEAHVLQDATIEYVQKGLQLHHCLMPDRGQLTTIAAMSSSQTYAVEKSS